MAVPLDKDLGSPETSAEIIRAFGVTAERVESITVLGGCECKHGLRVGGIWRRLCVLSLSRVW